MWLPVQLPIDLTLASTTPAAVMSPCVTVGSQSVNMATIIQGVSLNGLNVYDASFNGNGALLYLDAGNTASYPGTGTTWTGLSNNASNATLVGSPPWTSAGTNTGVTFAQYAANGGEFVALGDNFWLGDIGVCAVYGQALTADQIQQNYNAVRSRYGV